LVFLETNQVKINLPRLRIQVTVCRSHVQNFNFRHAAVFQERVIL